MKTRPLGIALAGIVTVPVFAAPPAREPFDAARIEDLTGAKGAFNKKGE